MKVAESIPQQPIPADKLQNQPQVQEMTCEEAENIIQSTIRGDKQIWSFIPVPSYLPFGYDLQKVVMDGRDKVFLFYSDEEMREEVKYWDDLQRLLKQDGGVKFWVLGWQAEGMKATTQFPQSAVDSTGNKVVNLGPVKGLLNEHSFQGQARYRIEWQLNDYYFCLQTDYGTLTEYEVTKVASSTIPESIDLR